LPKLGRPCRNIGIMCGMEKLEWCGYPAVNKFEDMVTHFDTIHERDGQTADGQTDTARWHDLIGRASA